MRITEDGDTSASVFLPNSHDVGSGIVVKLLVSDEAYADVIANTKKNIKKFDDIAFSLFAGATGISGISGISLSGDEHIYARWVSPTGPLAENRYVVVLT